MVDHCKNHHKLDHTPIDYKEQVWSVDRKFILKCVQPKSGCRFWEKWHRSIACRTKV